MPNPFDLPGPAFLGLYAALFVACLVGAIWLRVLLRQPGGEPPAEARELSPYEVAYLAGGAGRAAQAVVANLVHSGVLAVSAANRNVTRAGRRPLQAHPLEEEVFEAVDPNSGGGFARLKNVVAGNCEATQQRLQELGLLLSGGQKALAASMPLLLMLALALFGVIKIGVGVSRHRPVGFLVAFSVLTALVGLAFLLGLHRSRRGDRALALLKSEQAALETTAKSDPARLSGTDLALALGLYGAGILTVGPLADLRTTLLPPGGGDGGLSCGGGGGCGGGCGGGGCGGCGGGG